MSKFVFKLQGVLRQREHVETQRQRELALVQQQMAQLQSELRALDATAQQSTSDLRNNHLVGRLDLAYIAAHRRYMHAVQRQALQLMQRMAVVQQHVEQAQRALADAARDRKAIEKLRDKHRERWQAEQDRREMLAQDEINVQLSYELLRADPLGDDLDVGGEALA